MFKLISYLILALIVTNSATAQQVKMLMPQNVPNSNLKISSRGMCGLDLTLRGLRANADFKSREAKMNQIF